MKAGDLVGANAIKNEIDNAGVLLSHSEAGKVSPVPHAELKGDNIPPSLLRASSDFSKKLSSAVSELNKIYIEKLSAIQRVKLEQSDLAEANAAQKWISELEQEQTALATGSPWLPSPAEESQRISLLDEKWRGNWKEDQGVWTFRADKLIGKGDSSIHYYEKLNPPFELSFDLEVKEGQRPRVQVGKYTIGHDGYNFSLCLFPRLKSAETHPYKVDRKISVKMLADPAFVELWVDGKLLERREEEFNETVSSIEFRGGDAWSPGESEFSSIEIKR